MSGTTIVPALRETANREPWEYLRTVRAAGDIVWDGSLNAWLITSYDLARTVWLSDKELWQSQLVPDPELGRLYGMTTEQWVQFLGFGSSRFLAMLDGEDQTRQHRWWMREFSAPKNVGDRHREEVVRPVIDEQIGKLVERDMAELCHELIDRVTPRVIAAMLGLPWDDDGWLDRFQEQLDIRLELKQTQVSSEAASEMIDPAFETSRAISELIRPYVQERRTGDGDDFISTLWREAPTIYGSGYDETDIIGSAASAWEAGSQTTAHAMANALYLLLSRDDLRRLLLEQEGDEQRASVERFIEESLRLYGPIFFRPRVARRGLDLGGVRIERGDLVVVLMLAASRDPAHYPNPDEVDLHRKAARDHGSFFVGPRACPGQGFARAELRELLCGVLQALPDVRFDPDGARPEYRGHVIRRWEPLHVLLRG